jgi:histidinol-phosphate/aromatic aminotransferase/cobyric acid decarboxylase-like protein
VSTRSSSRSSNTVGSVAVPPAGSHGGDGPRLAAALGVDPAEILDLSQSLNPAAPDPIPLIVRHLEAIRRYPDPAVAQRTLAVAIGVDHDRVVLTNGGSEAIALVAAEFGRGWVEEPEFALYRRHLRDLDPGAPRFRSNPCNPTGLLAPHDAVAAVWDEAFYPLATGTWTRGDAALGAGYVVGSLTKLFACPGLRLGYVLAPAAEAAARLRHRQPQWSVNGIATAALPDLLATVDLEGWSDTIRRWRQDLVAVLSAHGLTAQPSDANWVLVEAPALRDALAPHAISVRDCTSFGLPRIVRIAVPDPFGLARLDGALARCGLERVLGAGLDGPVAARSRQGGR